MDNVIIIWKLYQPVINNYCYSALVLEMVFYSKNVESYKWIIDNVHAKWLLIVGNTFYYLFKNDNLDLLLLYINTTNTLVGEQEVIYQCEINDFILKPDLFLIVKCYAVHKDYPQKGLIVNWIKTFCLPRIDVKRNNDILLKLSVFYNAAFLDDLLSFYPDINVNVNYVDMNKNIDVNKRHYPDFSINEQHFLFLLHKRLNSE